jgi:2-phospho-L-lactate guanylyltransferase
MSHVLIPVKNLSNAKFRLSSVLNLEERHLLCLSMLNDVIDAVINVKQIKNITIITSDKKIREYTKKMSILCLNDEKNDLNLALEFGVKKIIHKGAKSILILPIDIPLVKSTDIESLIDDGLNSRCMIVVPSLDGGGTNALFMRMPDIIKLKFGPTSFKDHCTEARSKKIPIKILRIFNMALDIDTNRDLIRFLNLKNRTKTYSFLRRINFMKRL